MSRILAVPRPSTQNRRLKSGFPQVYRELYVPLRSLLPSNFKSMENRWDIFFIRARFRNALRDEKTREALERTHLEAILINKIEQQQRAGTQFKHSEAFPRLKNQIRVRPPPNLLI